MKAATTTPIQIQEKADFGADRISQTRRRHNESSHHNNRLSTAILNFGKIPNPWRRFTI